MPSYYLDTSALVKRYVAEAGTAWVQSLSHPATGHDIFTARVTGAEMVAALYRRVRTGATTAADARHADATFDMDWRLQYRILEASAAVVERAMHLARRHPLRGFDAVHVAAALELDDLFRGAGSPRLTFISADQGQLRAADGEGLTIDDPNAHA